ncbi:MAG: APC family permease [Caulobacterales bacterium]
MATPPQQNAPERHVSTAYLVMLSVGMVVGAGIFKSPAQVADAAGSVEWLYAAWIAGGLLTLAGALCYSELATAFPNAGGDYHFLRLAYGKRIAFLFAWARFAVINSGSIAFLGFVIGDYLNAVPSFHLGQDGPAIYAAISVLLLTMFNLRGTRKDAAANYAITGLEVGGLIVIAIAALWLALTNTPPLTSNARLISGPIPPGLGLAMVFVLLAFGGWSEIATLSAEVKDSKRGMARAHIYSILVITLLYILVNWAFLRGLGLSGLAQSDAPAADLMARALGDNAALLLAIAVALAAITSINATIIVGARTTYAVANEFRAFSALGKWDHARNIPAAATLAQGAIGLALVGLGAWTRDGFATLVDYTAPAFWIFMTLSGFALIVLRYKQPNAERPFKTPFYPVTPLIFCIANIFMLWSSASYVMSLENPRRGMTLGFGVLVLGIAALAYAEIKASRASQSADT